MMPAYNAEPFIGQAIESLQEQSYQSWELIIVDDGSKDGTGEVAVSYDDPRIKYFHQENRGEAAARNAALEHINGEYLSFLDADDLYLPHHLEEMVIYLAAHSDRDGVYTDGYYIDPQKKYLQTLSSRRRGPFEGKIFEELVSGSDVFGPPVCIMLRSQAVLGNRLRFDEKIIIGPDWDFFLKFAEKGMFGYIAHITCLYRLHPTSISIRTNLEKRRLELAKCRLNAIKLESFKSCSESTCYNVFYDLLVNLLCGQAERQSEIIEEAEFITLPKRLQARLLRLMASKLLLYEHDSPYVKTWLNRARQIDPSDRRGTILWLIYKLSPGLLKFILRLRTKNQPDPRGISLYADMKI
jgi:glycosyltransferase involved in cell wall biosynthesis